MRDKTPKKPTYNRQSDRSQRPMPPPTQRQSVVRDSVKTRRAAAMALQDILKNGTVLEQALSSLADYNELSSRDRAFARAIVATTFRRFAQIQAALKPLIRKAPPSFIMAVLQTAAAQILFLKTPAHAAVGETVDVLKSRSSSKGFANMANASRNHSTQCQYTRLDTQLMGKNLRQS